MVVVVVLVVEVVVAVEVLEEVVVVVVVVEDDEEDDVVVAVAVTVAVGLAVAVAVAVVVEVMNVVVQAVKLDAKVEVVSFFKMNDGTTLVSFHYLQIFYSSRSAPNYVEKFALTSMISCFDGEGSTVVEPLPLLFLSVVKLGKKGCCCIPASSPCHAAKFLSGPKDRLRQLFLVWCYLEAV
ncbi:Hypothetical predicted protein [Prunus dulcis]|uniref:Uncharacterized protein n=1 Tax=Prunus dulcis TaxID=3755 RepID=A0A5E4GKU4_PRUDU|nr:Hypothetical predicted protein [Prunus dulcis]